MLLRSMVLNFFVYGSSSQFWFFPALFFSMIMAILFNKVHILKYLGVLSVPLYLIGLLGCSYKALGDRIPIIQILVNSQHFTLIRRVVLMGLPFFMLGYFINLYVAKRKSQTEKKEPDREESRLCCLYFL
jgi:hypothetical protein